MEQRIPFKDIGIPPDVGECTADAIQHLLSERPNAPIDVQSISDKTGYLGPVVRKVLYALLALRMLKATFLPRHRACGHIIGGQEHSVELIRQKAREGHYVCFHCFERAEGPEDIEIQIVFWKPGADVDHEAVPHR